MKRRSAIRCLVMISGGVLLLPACNHSPGSASVTFRTIKIDAEQEKLLAEIATAIIPATDTPGAGELGVHLFVLKMVDDLYEKERQEAFFNGLSQLDALTKKNVGHSFIHCTPLEKQSVLERLEKNNGVGSETAAFYQIMKQRTIEGYLNSRYVMTNLIKYELIPSVRYDGYHRV